MDITPRAPLAHVVLLVPLVPVVSQGSRDRAAPVESLAPRVIQVCVVSQVSQAPLGLMGRRACLETPVPLALLALWETAEVQECQECQE